jgi:hypothetical protein
MQVLLHVQCNHCGTWAVTDNGAVPDRAVRCTSAADDPPGSPDGCCSAEHASHEEYIAHVETTKDATARPVTITMLPGTVNVSPALEG